MEAAAVIELAGQDGAVGPPAIKLPQRRRSAPRAVAAQTSSARIASGPHPLLDRRFEAVVFDWDGTAVPDRLADAARVRTLVEDLTAAAVDVIVVSGTHVGNVDGQLAARPTGPGRLHLCLNRGSEVFEVDRTGIHLVDRREATPEEEAKLDRSAELTVDRLGARGLVARVVSSRLNRRKIDLIPEPAWAEPPKARLPDLLAAVERRLARAGIGSLAGAAAIALEAARDAGLRDAKITSDAKHVEIGLTDKADSARWAFRALSERGIGAGLVLVVGDEFGAARRPPGQRLAHGRSGGVGRDVRVRRTGAGRRAAGRRSTSRWAVGILRAARGPAGAAPGGAPPDDRPGPCLDGVGRRC